MYGMFPLKFRRRSIFHVEQLKKKGCTFTTSLADHLINSNETSDILNILDLIV